MGPLPVSRRVLLLFVAGAIGGTLGDLCHVMSGTESYASFPYWVPLEFGLSTVAIGMSQPWFDGWTGARTAPRPGLKSEIRIQAGLLVMLATWAASGFLGLATGGLKDALVGSIAILAWWFLDRTWTGIALGMITAVLGTSIEFAQARAGVFSYAPEHQNLFGVPSWLPFLYVCASVSVGNFGRMLARGLIP